MSTQQLPKIFVYCVDCPFSDKDVSGYALAEDGVGLAGHISSNVAWSRVDMIDSGWKDGAYKEHYPDGYEIVWLGDAPNDNNYANPEFVAAFEKNQARAAEAKKAVQSA